MLKTSVDHKATPATVFIVYGGLKGYVKRGTWFLLRTLMKAAQLKKQLPEKLSKDIKTQVAMIVSMYIILKEKVDAERVLSTVQARAIAFSQVDIYGDEAPVCGNSWWRLPQSLRFIFRYLLMQWTLLRNDRNIMCANSRLNTSHGY